MYLKKSDIFLTFLQTTTGSVACVKIRYIVMEHSPDCAIFQGNATLRSHAQVRHLGLFEKGSVTAVLRIPGVTALHGGIAKIVQQSMEANGETRISKDQAGRLSRFMKGSTHTDYMQDLTRLAPTIEWLKAVDPEGVYEVHTKACTYGGGDEGELYEGQEFASVIICPSSAQKFYAADEDGMLALDMSHRHGVYGGTQASAVTKDGYGHNHRLMWAIFDRENKENWVQFTDKMGEKLPGTKFVISDQTKGKRRKDDKDISKLME